MRVRSRPLLSVLFAGVSMAAGCTDLPSGVPEGAQRVAIEPVQLDSYFVRFDSSERLVIRDEATWASTLARIMRPDVSPPTIPPRPPVDFASDVLIIAARGPSGGGDSIAIDDVHALDGDAWISVTERSPRAGCPVTAILTFPAVVVVVPRFEGEATFIEHVERYACD
jgi:hypothetical protein